MTRIYYASISEDIHYRLLQKYKNDFSTAFLKKLQRYRRWQDAQLSLLGRLLLKHGLTKFDVIFSEKDLIFSEFNKPMLRQIPIQFNISHSGEIAICVISDVTEVGVDIEKVQDVEVENFKAQMTKTEWERIESAGFVEQEFYNYWTEKESILKANGKGLSIPLKSFEVKNGISELEQDVFFLDPIYIEDGYKCHIAFKNKLDENHISPQKIMFKY